MSATFKNAKKKATQLELRKIMTEHKRQLKEVKKIDSPLAKYNETGQLTCILCKAVIRSETVWPVHINSKQHKQNIEVAKKLKEQTNNFTTPFKRPHSPVGEQEPVKKLKGILKNSKTENNGIPDDFFDGKNGKGVKASLPSKTSVNIQSESAVKPKETPMESEDVLPEGFFDDPKLDAKARHQEYKDPVEEEWERFQKEIRDADNESAAIIAEDQDEATTERQIDEIDEQINNWSRVLNLEKKKVEIVLNTNSTSKNEVEELSNEEEEGFDEFLDWRAKQSFK